MLENTIQSWLPTHKILSICEPIVKVLRMVDLDVACMRFVYKCMDRRNKHITTACDNDQSQFQNMGHCG